MKKQNSEAEFKYYDEVTALDEMYREEMVRIMKEYAKSVFPYNKGSKVKYGREEVVVEKVLLTFVKDDFPIISIIGRFNNGKKKEINIDDLIW